MALLIAALVVAVLTIMVISLQNRLGGNPAKSVDAFRRAIQALKPERKFPDRLR